MKYLITESQFDKVIFKYLDNQDFIRIQYGVNDFFVNSKEDTYAQIKFNSHRCTIDRKLMTEITSFFSLKNIDSISYISKWVASKTGTNYRTVDVESDIIIYYF